MNATKSPQQAYGISLLESGSILRDELGAVRVQLTEEGLKSYRYVKLAAGAAAAGVNGTVYVFSDKLMQEVTNDISDSSQNKPAGVGIAPLAIGEYGYIQCKGYHPLIATNGDDNIADGDNLIVSTTDGTCSRIAAGTAPTFKRLGVAMSADVDANNTVEGLIDCE